MTPKIGPLNASIFKMETDLKAIIFNFDYTKSNLTEKEAINKGYKQLSGKELHDAIVNKQFYGNYPMGYKFFAEIYADGTTKGINNVGSYDFGHWMIDYKKQTLNLHWQNAWIDTKTRAYEVNGTIEFYDVNTGHWRTTFLVF